MKCPWKRLQAKNAHGDVTRYDRSCHWQAGHLGPHEPTRAAKQASSGVWVNRDTGETVTQDDGGFI